jgi:hypothetical protein
MVRRLTSTPDAIILSPLQGGTRILSVPGVKTPGLALLSLRDKSDGPRRERYDGVERRHPVLNMLGMCCSRGRVRSRW